MQKKIIDEIRAALKNGGNTEIDIPLTKDLGKIPNSSLQEISNNQNNDFLNSHSNVKNSLNFNPENSHNFIQFTGNYSNKISHVFEKNLETELSKHKFSLDEITTATRGLKVRNNFYTELNKRKSINLRLEDQQNILYERNRLSRIQPYLFTDDLCINKRFPLHVLPYRFQKLVKSIALSLNVPVESVAPGLLGAIFISGRGQFKIQVKSNYFESFTEYIVVVQHSGENKSAIVRIYRSVFDKYVAKLQEAYNENLPIQKLILEAYKNSKKNILKKLMKGVDITDPMKINAQYRWVADMLAPLEIEIAKILYKPTYFSDSPTIPKLTVNMRDQNEVLSIFDAEGGIWKHRIRPNEDTILLKAYTMEHFSTETITNGSVMMETPVLTICSYIQPRVAEKIYSKKDLHDDGLLPRILPVFIPRDQNAKNADPLDVPPDLIEMYEEKILQLLQHADQKDDDETKRPLYTLSLADEAYTSFVDYKQTIYNQLSAGEFKNFEAFASKLAGHAVRLAGAVHFLQHEEPWNQPIDSSAMKAGIVIADFFAAHANSVFDKDRIEAIRYAKKILKKIKEKPQKGQYNPRELQRAIGHCTATQINSGLNLLERHYYVTPYIDSSNKTTFIINPNIHNGGFGYHSWSNQSFF